MVESKVASAAWNSKHNKSKLHTRARFMQVVCVFAMHAVSLGISLEATPIIEYDSDDCCMWASLVLDSQVFSQPPVLPYFWDESCKLDNQADEQPRVLTEYNVTFGDRMIWFFESHIVYCLHALPLGSWNQLFCYRLRLITSHWFHDVFFL